jgi:hypothetical protein
MIPDSGYTRTGSATLMNYNLTRFNGTINVTYTTAFPLQPQLIFAIK